MSMDTILALLAAGSNVDISSSFSHEIVQSFAAAAKRGNAHLTLRSVKGFAPDILTSIAAVGRGHITFVF